MLKLGQITTRAGGLMWALSCHSLRVHLAATTRTLLPFAALCTTVWF